MGRKPQFTSEMTAHQRAAAVTLWLVQGNRLTTAEIGKLTHSTWGNAAYMMDRLTLVLPIDRDEEGRWFLIPAPI